MSGISQLSLKVTAKANRETVRRILLVIIAMSLLSLLCVGGVHNFEQRECGIDRHARRVLKSIEK